MRDGPRGGREGGEPERVAVPVEEAEAFDPGGAKGPGLTDDRRAPLSPCQQRL